MEDADETTSAGSSRREADKVIDRLYEVAVDPRRYEALLDHWEEMIAPRRRAANAGRSPIRGLDHLKSHFERADQVLDRVIDEAETDDAEGMLARIELSAAFALDRDGQVRAVNEAARRRLGLEAGSKLSASVLEADDTDKIRLHATRLQVGNSDGPVMLTGHRSVDGGLVVLHLRLVRPERAEPFVIVVTSVLHWPEGFEKMLRAAFDLTKAETGVVRALAQGRTLAEIAEDRGRSLGTIRSQLKSIMAKTETRSQTELMRLTLSTMELTQSTQDEISALEPISRGFETLEPRPFQTVTLPDGRRMDYLILGDPNGRPVLFLPLDYGLVRWPASAEADAARRAMKVVVPIRAGYGASTPLPKGTPYVAQLADDIAALFDHLGIADCPVISLGGDSFIAVTFSVAYPGRMRALIACAGVLPLTRYEQYDRMKKWHRFILAGARYTPHLLPFMVKAGFALARRVGKHDFVRAVYGDAPIDVSTFEEPEVYEAMICGSEVCISETHSAHDAFAREIIAHEAADWTADVLALRDQVPVHFLNGLRCPQITPETLAEFREDFPWIDFRLYPDAGQLLFFRKWRDVIDLVEGYLEPRPDGI